MYNPIEEKRRFVQGQIHKSFESSINVNDEVGIEKAHKDGDIHPKHPNWVWVSSAAGGKGDWRIAGGRTHKKAVASTTAANSTSNTSDNSKSRWWDDADEIKKRMNDPLTKQTAPHLIVQMAARLDELKKKQKATNASAPRKTNENPLGASEKEYAVMNFNQLKKELVGKIIKKETKTHGTQTFKVIEIVKYHPYSYSSETKNAIRCKDESGKTITISPKILNDGKYYADAKYSVTEDNREFNESNKNVGKRRYNFNIDGSPMDMSKQEDSALGMSMTIVQSNIKDLKEKLAQTGAHAVVTQQKLKARLEDQEGKLAEIEMEMKKRQLKRLQDLINSPRFDNMKQSSAILQKYSRLKKQIKI